MHAANSNPNVDILQEVEALQNAFVTGDMESVRYRAQLIATIALIYDLHDVFYAEEALLNEGGPFLSLHGIRAIDRLLLSLEGSDDHTNACDR